MSSNARLVGPGETFPAAADPAPERAAFDRIALLVLGMHRSGTSALARITNTLGCALPHNLIPPTPGNTTGHWESSLVAAFNDELLGAAGSAWDDFMPVNPGLRQSPIWRKSIERARALLRDEFDDAPLFVLKDPRICRLAPFWLEVLEAEQVFPAVVIPVRNPKEVAASHGRRDAMDVDYGQLLWLRHVLDAEQATRGRPRVFAHYPKLIDEWRDTAARIATQFHFVWPRSSPTAEMEIGGFLDPELRHHRQDDASIHNGFTPPWIADAFAIMGRWADDGESADDYPKLDRIAREFSAAAPNLVGALAKAKVFSRREAEYAEHVGAIARDRDQLAEDRKALILRHEEVATSNGVLTGQRDDLSDQLARLEEAHGALTERTDGLVLERNRLADDLAGTLSHLRQREEEADQTHRALSQSMARAAELVDQVERLGDQLSAAAAERGDLADRLDAARSALTSQDRIIGELRRELDMSRTKTLNLELANATLERNHGQRFKELAKLAMRLRALEADLEAERLNVFEIQAAARLSDRKRARQDQNLAWLREVYSLTSHVPRWWNYMPRRWRSAKLLGLLKASGHFDADRYRRENDDVRTAGVDPLFHYIVHGIGEDRRR